MHNTGSLYQQFRAFLAAPSLLKKTDFELFELQKTPENLPLNSEAPRGVFGKRMEFFFSRYIQSSSRYHLLGENVQIIKNGITLGELDFLIEDRQNGRKLHVEMACKFYLFEPQQGKSLWIGPNYKDRLHLKLKKLRERQFPLLFAKETRDFLPFPAHQFEQQLHLSGLLFTPWNQSPPSSELINPGAIAGQWLRAEQFKAKLKDHRFTIPQKENWLQPPDSATHWEDFKTTWAKVEGLLERQYSSLLWAQDASGNYQRFFIVWW